MIDKKSFLKGLCSRSVVERYLRLDSSDMNQSLLSSLPGRRR